MTGHTTVTLIEPLAAPDGTPITTVEIRRPNVGALRGLQLSLVQMQDVGAMIKLIPRVTHPALSPDQVTDELAPADFTEIVNRISLFFMTADQLAAVQANGN